MENLSSNLSVDGPHNELDKLEKDLAEKLAKKEHLEYEIQVATKNIQNLDQKDPNYNQKKVEQESAIAAAKAQMKEGRFDIITAELSQKIAGLKKPAENNRAFTPHPNISMERLAPMYIESLEDYDYYDSYDESLSDTENESDEAMTNFLPHPNISLFHDPEMVERFNRKNAHVIHPNIRIDRGTRRLTAPILTGCQALKCKPKEEKSTSDGKRALYTPTESASQEPNRFLGSESCACKKSTNVKTHPQPINACGKSTLQKPSYVVKRAVYTPLESASQEPNRFLCCESCACRKSTNIKTPAVKRALYNPSADKMTQFGSSSQETTRSMSGASCACKKSFNVASQSGQYADAYATSQKPTRSKSCASCACRKSTIIKACPPGSTEKSTLPNSNCEKSENLWLIQPDKSDKSLMWNKEDEFSDKSCDSFEVCEKCRQEHSPPTNRSLGFSDDFSKSTVMHPTSFASCSQAKSKMSARTNDVQSCQSLNVCSYCKKQFNGSSNLSASTCKSRMIGAESGNSTTGICGGYGKPPSNLPTRVSSCEPWSPKLSQLSRKTIPNEVSNAEIAYPSCDSFNVCETCRKSAGSRAVENITRSETDSNPNSIKCSSAVRSQTSFKKTSEMPIKPSPSVPSIKFASHSGRTPAENIVDSCKSCNDFALAMKQKSNTSLSSSTSKKSVNKASDCISFNECNECAMARDQKSNFPLSLSTSKTGEAPLPAYLENPGFGCNSFDVCDVCAKNLGKIPQVPTPSAPSCVSSFASPFRLPERQLMPSSVDRASNCAPQTPSAEPQSNANFEASETSNCNSFDVCNECADAMEKNQSSHLTTEPGCVASLKSFTNCATEPKKPVTSPSKVLYQPTSRKRSSNLECPPNPCESIEQVKAVAVETRRFEKRKPSARKTKSKILKEETKKSSSAIATNENLSKKYQRMKYEIETQNFFIDKLNRELKINTSKCLPERELCQLKIRLDREVSKLRDMVQYAMCLQRQNRGEKWGAIPVSTVNDEPKKRSQSCPQEASKKLQPPVIPSGISNLTGFSELEDIKMSDGKDEDEMEIELQDKDKIIQDLREQMELMDCHLQKLQAERKRTLEAVKCPEAAIKGDLYGGDCKSPNPCSDDTELDMKTVDDMMAQLTINLETVKCEIAKLRGDLNDMKNE